MSSHTLSLSCCCNRPCHGLIHDCGPSSVGCHHAGLQPSAQTALSAGIPRRRDEDRGRRSLSPTGRLRRRVNRTGDHQPLARCLSLGRYTYVAWHGHDRTSPRSPAIPNGRRGASSDGLDLTRHQRERWPSKLPVTGASLTASKSARGHNTSAVARIIAIPTQLRKPKLSPRSYKSRHRVSALRQMNIKSPLATWTFLIFTELISLWLRISRFIVAG